LIDNKQNTKKKQQEEQGTFSGCFGHNYSFRAFLCSISFLTFVCQSSIFRRGNLSYFQLEKRIMNGAAAAAAIAEAVKASGAIVRVEPKVFVSLLSTAENPLVIIAVGKIFKTTFRYLTAYKGFVFYTKSSGQLLLPGNVELIAAKSIWVPQ
jgi:hypothetical protein